MRGDKILRMVRRAGTGQKSKTACAQRESFLRWLCTGRKMAATREQMEQPEEECSWRMVVRKILQVATLRAIKMGKPLATG